MAAETTITVGILARDDAAIMHTYARFPIALCDGKGCWVRDAEGREYLDFVAGIAVNNLGHRHPALVAALQHAAAGLWHVSNLYATEPNIRLAERLCNAAGMQRAFFCNSGAESIEAAIKLARKVGGPERREIIAATDSFHGRTFGALSATGQEKYRAGFVPMLPGISHVPYGDVAALDAAITGSTAAVLLEAIQGEGGVRPAPAGYLDAVRKLCDERGCLLIFDEVQTGMGRTGKMFAFQHTAIAPDVICLAKALANGLPMGAILARGAAATAFQPGDHASTFGGNPLVASVANAVLDELERPGFFDGVATVSALIESRLRGLAEELPAKTPTSKGIRDVRGQGMMWGVELAGITASDVGKKLIAHGVLAIGAGPHVLRLVPPLILTETEANAGLDSIAKVLCEFVAQ